MLKSVKRKGLEATMLEMGVEYKHFIDHMELKKSGNFSWEKLGGTLAPLRELTELKNLSTSKRGDEVSGEETFYQLDMAWVFYNSEIFRTAIPLSIISEYCQRPNYMFGTPIYDGALRLQCDLL
jgi:hypothetical protein